MRLLLNVILLALVACQVQAKAGDTLSNFDGHKGYVFYVDPGVAVQAARFELARPSHIKSIALILGGKSDNGAVTVHLFGNEGGLPAPGIQKDLMPPLTVHKKKAGIDTVIIELRNPVYISTHQFFVAVDHVDPQVLFISDCIAKSPSCVALPDMFYYQALKLNGQWTWAKFGFAVSVIAEYDAVQKSSGFTDVSIESGIKSIASTGLSMAWADLDRDSYLDLLINGRLYRNNHDASFSDITIPAGLSGDPKASVFIDLDNDRRLDILFLGTNDPLHCCRLFMNNGDGTFHEMPISLDAIGNPTSCSIADVNNDGYLDVFIGQKPTALLPHARNHLLINDRHNGFVDQTELLHGSIPVEDDTCAGSQWVDVDSDGDLDLYAVNGGQGKDRLWLNNGNGTFTDATSKAQMCSEESYTLDRNGCSWADYNNDGNADLLESCRVPLSDVAGADHNPGIRLASRVGPLQYRMAEGSPGIYEEKQGGGAWGDLDNDGHLDMIITSSCACRYAHIYTQKEDGAFEEKSFELGLPHMNVGPDAIWVDVDNDGRLDLATFTEGQFKLFKNDGSPANAYLEIDLEGQDAVGARAEVFADGVRYTDEVTSGRGLLMQDPARLHYGLAGAKSLDSIIVHWSNGRTEVYRDIVINGIRKLYEGGTQASPDNTAEVLSTSPNPFKDRLRLSYRIASSGYVKIDIYNVNGELIRGIVSQKMNPGLYEAIWDAKNVFGEPVPQGTYIYKMNFEGREASGKVVLVK